MTYLLKYDIWVPNDIIGLYRTMAFAICSMHDPRQNTVYAIYTIGWLARHATKALSDDGAMPAALKLRCWRIFIFHAGQHICASTLYYYIIFHTPRLHFRQMQRAKSTGRKILCFISEMLFQPRYIDDDRQCHWFYILEQYWIAYLILIRAAEWA